MANLDWTRPYDAKYLSLPPPVFNVLTPPLQSSTLNAAFFDPSNQPVTDQNRSQWEVVSASADWITFGLTSALGEGKVTLFKGTMAFNTGQGGFSESLYSPDPTMTQIRMMGLMQQVMAARCALSNTNFIAATDNPVIPQFVRVEDTLIKRASFSASESTARKGFFSTVYGNKNPTTNDVSPDNLNLNLGWRILYNSGLSRQNAYQCLHGVPLAAFALTDALLTYQDQFLREARPQANWTKLLNAYVQLLNKLQLGFRTIAGVWNNDDGSPGAYATPNSVFYNTAMQMVELQWTNAPPDWPITPAQLAGQKPANYPANGCNMRVQVRKWKGFQVLQGRWAGIVVPPQQGYNFALRILRTCRAPTVANMPVVSPIAWTVWYPGQAFNSGSSSPLTQDQVNVSGSLVFIESKKLGRNFEEQRGRARNRPT